MTAEGLGLSPGSRLPVDAEERDLLLRRVPELALLPELEALRFPADRVLHGSDASHASRIAELADAAYRDRLAAALARTAERARLEQNGGLAFLSAALSHFVTALPPERHPLVAALYFLSSPDLGLSADPVALLAARMDDYDAGFEDETAGEDAARHSPLE